MFTEPRSLDHDGWVRAAREAAARVTAQEARDAFLASLTSRRLDLRSALGSYALARVLPEHPYSAWREFGCSVCRLHVPRDPDGAIRPENLNDFSVWRFYGGTVGDVRYAAFDQAGEQCERRMPGMRLVLRVRVQQVNRARQLPCHPGIGLLSERGEQRLSGLCSVS